MLFNSTKNKSIFLIAILLLAVTGFLSAQDKIIELKFAKPPVSDSDESRTLQSLVRARAISETYSTGGLYLMTHYGDREELFQKENQKAIDNPLRNQTWRYCSLFSTASDDSVIVGRNWDNQNVGSVIVSLYYPPKGYASISFSRAIDMGFPLNVDLLDFKSSEFGKKLLLAPFYATEGINEHGLAVTVAGVREIFVKSKGDKESVTVTFLIRKILDQTRNVEEAVNLVERYVPFVLDKNSLAAHFLIADSSGRSVILEYVEDQWKRIDGDKSWQILTNKPVYKVPDAKLKEQCWRYRSISGTLEKTRGKVDWKGGLKILQDVSQKGTTWSVIYSLKSKELHFSVYQNWTNIYQLKIF